MRISKAERQRPVAIAGLILLAYSGMPLKAEAPSQPELRYLSSVLPEIQAKEWTKAEQELLAGLKQFPKSAVLKNALGIVYEQENRKAEAIDAFEQAIQLLPGFTAAELHLASLLAETTSCERAKRFFLAAAQDTSEVSALDAAGIGLAQCKDFASAVQVLSKAHRVKPESAATTFNLALAQYESGEYQGSLEMLESLPAGPEQERPEVLFLKGNLLKALKRPGAAEALAAACRNQSQEEFCAAAAVELIRDERFIEAVDLLQKADPSVSTSAAALSTLGLAQYRLGRYQEAISSYSRAIAKDKSLEAPREGLVFLLYMTGDLARASAVAADGLKAPHPGFYLFYLNALVMYRQSSQLWPAALSSLESVIKCNASFAPSYFLRGKIRMQQGSLNAALDDFTTAVHLDPSYPLPYYKMAQIFERQGHAEKAEQAQKKFMNLGSLREEEVLARQAQNQLLSSAR